MLLRSRLVNLYVRACVPSKMLRGNQIDLLLSKLPQTKQAMLTINNIKTSIPSTTMTIDNKHNFADAEVIFEGDYVPVPSAAGNEPVAVLVSSNDSDSKTPFVAATTIHQTTSSSSAPIVVNGTIVTPAPTGQTQNAPDMTAHNVQHKKNVVTGVFTGVLVGAILLGPVGAIAGGFLGSHIVNSREKR